MEQFVRVDILKQLEEKNLSGVVSMDLLRGKCAQTSWQPSMMSWVDGGREIDAVYLDFSKMFYSVSQGILVMRLCGDR